ncbi:MAG: GspH/FimT family pseudopilin [Desulfobacterales bacterium]|nr:GspH/FimT family pseudopilin [Desulfobacterales bacterium]
MNEQKTQMNDGFTLIELMIVFAIIAIISTIAMPNIRLMINNSRLNEAARDIQGVIQLARSTAIRRNINVGINFTTGIGNNGTYVCYVDNDASWAFSIGDLLIRDGTMPNNVNLIQASPLSMRFTSRGIPAYSGFIRLENATVSRSRRIDVFATGYSRIQ